MAEGEEAKKRDEFLIAQAMEDGKRMRSIRKRKSCNKDQRALELTAKDR